MVGLRARAKIIFRISGARIWGSFARSGGAKTGGIASSFEAKG
jgi:hypothetical protein